MVINGNLKRQKFYIYGGNLMHSLEATMIVPLIIILVLMFSLMIYFAAGVSLSEVNHSKYFIVNMTENGQINSYEGRETSLIMSYSHDLFREVFCYSVREDLSNPFSTLMDTQSFNFESQYILTKVKRLQMAILKYSVDSVFNYQAK